MAKFLTGFELNLALVNLIKEAKKEITLVSPFIKLHPEIRDLLIEKGQDPNIMITILFGKNEEDITASLNREDFEVFKEMANIEICYNERLHAKYYANEKIALLTSLNLHSYSINNNIEFGVLVGDEKGWEGLWTEGSLDVSAYNFFDEVIEKAEVKFDREPHPKSDGKRFSLRRLDYTHSETVKDDLSALYEAKKGYCIRSGEEIKFDPKSPMSAKSFKEWKDSGEKNTLPEKYCHFSGEESNGETSLAKPILKKYYHKAMKSV